MSGGNGGSVTGVIPHDSPYVGNPVGIGGYATSATIPSAVTAGDAVRMITDLIGRKINTPWAAPENSIIADVAPWANGNAQELFAAQGGTKRVYITELYFANNGSGGGQFWLFRDATKVKTWDLQANARYILHFPFPLRGDANKSWSVQTSTTVTSTYCNASGFVLDY